MFYGHISRLVTRIESCSFLVKLGCNRLCDRKTASVMKSTLENGLENNYQSKYNRNKLTTHHFSHHFRSYSTKVEDNQPQNSRWNETRRIFLQSPDARQLYQEVLNAGKFTIKLVSPEETVSGVTLAKKREIYLSKKNPELGPVLLFELNNLRQANEVIRIDENIRSLGREGYLACIQKVEWQSTLKSHEIARKSIDFGVWPTSWDRFNQAFTGHPNATMNWTTLEGFQKTQESNMQADVYRQQWYKLCNPAGLDDFRAQNFHKWKAFYDKFSI